MNWNKLFTHKSINNRYKISYTITIHNKLNVDIYFCLYFIVCAI